MEDSNMSQTICFFRKYLLTRAQQHNNGKTNMEESQVTKRRTSAHPLLPPKFDCNFNRPPSLLEQELLPRLRCDALPSKLLDDKSSISQLTIFYAGSVNVYNNLPADKAQAIMLLAGESSLSIPIVQEMPTVEVRTPSCQSNSSSLHKSKAGLPKARRYSIQCFLEKRRGRQRKKAPYASPITQHEDDEGTIGSGCNQDHSSTLSPFPLRLGYVFDPTAD
ncbi:hypothetical protein FH972_004494 [Carpinus fangiana]|uniref:Protein TIFY n=1 Tax=Carpinus fangiana TaxID=176857 RepID=A0A5N6QPP4_9ROSI|nr:hypothetical protein FH972_004494 [Carpinus fangiana]